MNSLKLIGLAACCATLVGCNAGEMRMWNDALSAANGYTTTYPDQSQVEYVGDIRWESGVSYGEGYLKIKNTGNNYCRVRIKFEDGTYDYWNVDPGESYSSYVSLYNQDRNMQTLCNTTRAVYSEPFE